MIQNCTEVMLPCAKPVFKWAGSVELRTSPESSAMLTLVVGAGGGSSPPVEVRWASLLLHAAMLVRTATDAAGTAEHRARRIDFM